MVTKVYMGGGVEHVQSVAASEWLVKHNLGRLPVVDVFIQLPGWATLRKVIPEDVIIVDSNTAKITFAGNMVSGRAVVR